jgi:hypothetical protein
VRGFIDATYGGSVALQLAKLALVTPAELKAAGGNMGKATVAKALELVQHVRAAQEARDEGLRRIVREELAALQAGLEIGDKAADLVRGFLGRVKEASSGFGIRDALGMIAEARKDLLPYTDQKQPLAIDHTLNQDKPSVILLGAAPTVDLGAAGIEKTEVFEGVCEVVSQPKSHDDTQAADPPSLFGPPAAD